MICFTEIHFPVQPWRACIWENRAVFNLPLENPPGASRLIAILILVVHKKGFAVIFSSFIPTLLG